MKIWKLTIQSYSIDDLLLIWNDTSFENSNLNRNARKYENLFFIHSYLFIIHFYSIKDLLMIWNVYSFENSNWKPKEMEM